MISEEDIIAMKKALDDASIPIEGRFVQYVGRDGFIYTLSHGCMVDEYMFNQMPDCIQSLFMGVRDADTIPKI